MHETVNLEQSKQRYAEQTKDYKASVLICAGTGCMANGSMKVYEKFREAVKTRGLSISVAVDKDKADYMLKHTGCQGLCQLGPLVTLLPQNILYTKVRESDVEEIIDKTLINGQLVERLLYDKAGEPAHHIKDIPFYVKQNRMVLKLCGYIDVNDIDEYIANGGYFMARNAVFEMPPEYICDEILESGLRGRGGGFPTGRKWKLTLLNDSDEKYVICNGDEGDPGAFMNKCVMEGNPHSVLEGMIIAAKAVKATAGIIFVRAEYPLAVARLHKAIKAARSAGILGKCIFSSDFNFDIDIMEGAGAFVCGEETALLASVEGKRGMPMTKPPYPAQKGLFGKPTVINNVETLSTVPIILRMGAAEYKKLGTESSRGTKTFALTGHLVNTGLIEVPFGVTLREIVGDIGGGVIDDDGNAIGLDFKAVQMGGPSGGCLTHEHLDMPLDYENLKKVGSEVGSGGIVVMNKQTCMVKVARYFMQFTQNESCGKCIVCREGTKQMLNLLDDIIEGRAAAETLPLLEELANVVRLGSLCALGKAAPNPLLSTLKYFRSEYEAHAEKKYCPAGVCEKLTAYRIVAEKCKGCSACAKKCPVGAISGVIKSPYKIDGEKCIKCGVCEQSCKFGAIIRG